jgi:hypothetical protein
MTTTRMDRGGGGGGGDDNIQLHVLAVTTRAAE